MDHPPYETCPISKKIHGPEKSKDRVCRMRNNKDRILTFQCSYMRLSAQEWD